MSNHHETSLTENVVEKWGLLAQYENPAEIYHACEKVRDAGYTKWDANTPFPVHGLDKAMGLKASKLPWIVLCGGMTGPTLAMLFMIWTSAYDYPLNIGGKPLLSIPAFIPVTFELTVLFSAFCTFFGLWALCKLPRWHHPAFNSPTFEKFSDDKFFIMIEAKDDKFDWSKTESLLKASGSSHVEVVED